MSHKVIPPAQSSAQVTAAIARDSPQFPDLLEPVIPARSAGATTTAVAAFASDVYLYRFRVSEAITVANAKVWIGATAAGSIALGIYTESGGTWTLVVSTASTAAAGTNAIQTIAFATPTTYALAPGTDYWAALGGDASTGTLTILRGASLAGGGLGALGNLALLKSDVYSAGLPATIVTPAGTTTPYWIGLTP